ncbi:hypothetical protein ASZ90_014820 [hydrocarbon metagenome]|uniref:Uncharacterized protein n=1 Tax=hydrocarbon metagenome TaxID=938273 RepID=A0A0W8F3Q7_9ZZZZ
MSHHLPGRKRRVRKTNSSGMDEKDLLQGEQGRDQPNQPPSKENTRFIP